jgi:hypothetical protein
MSLTARFTFIALVFAVVSFILGPWLWQPAGDIVPSSAQMPFFIALAALESARDQQLKRGFQLMFAQGADAPR